MVKRVIIGKPEEAGARLVELLKGAREAATQGSTTPAGDKVLEAEENFYWARPDGYETSIRDVDSELEDARARIEDAEHSLVETGQRLSDAMAAIEGIEDFDFAGAIESIEDARAEIEAALEQLDDMGEVTTSGPPPANPTIGSSLWVSPTGSVFRAVECEEGGA